MQAASITDARAAEEIRATNTRYHDSAAAAYDEKWGIDFGAVGRAQVLSKLRKVLPGAQLDDGFDRSLEIGAGTGYFSLNLVQAGVVRRATCTDISPGMLSALAANAQRLGLANVRSVRAEAAALPFADGSFELILGHAVLHHLPDLERAFSEFHRVLVPGGTIAFAGEPSRAGDALARLPKQAAARLAPAWRRLMRAAPAPAACISDTGDQLEPLVDIHTFTPGQLASLADRAGFVDVRVAGEELTANAFGWFNRVLESTAAPEEVPMLWRQYAFRGYLALQQLDRRLLEPILPAAAFYNLLLSARRG